MTSAPFNQINWVDILTVILLVRMGYIGLQLGLWAELLKLGGAIGGIFISFRYYQAVGDWVAAHTSLRTEWAAALTMAVLVAVGYLLITRLLRVGEKMMQMTFEKKINQAGGLVAGLIRGLLVTSVAWVVCMQLPAPPLQESIEQHSLSGRKVSRMAPAVYDALTGIVRRLRD